MMLHYIVRKQAIWFAMTVNMCPALGDVSTTLIQSSTTILNCTSTCPVRHPALPLGANRRDLWPFRPSPQIHDISSHTAYIALCDLAHPANCDYLHILHDLANLPVIVPSCTRVYHALIEPFTALCQTAVNLYWSFFFFLEEKVLGLYGPTL